MFFKSLGNSNFYFSFSRRDCILTDYVKLKRTSERHRTIGRCETLKSTIIERFNNKVNVSHQKAVLLIDRFLFRFVDLTIRNRQKIEVYYIVHKNVESHLYLLVYSVTEFLVMEGDPFPFTLLATLLVTK